MHFEWWVVGDVPNAAWRITLYFRVTIFTKLTSGNCATMVDVSARGELETWGDGEGNGSHVEACVFMGEK